MLGSTILLRLSPVLGWCIGKLQNWCTIYKNTLYILCALVRPLYFANSFTIVPPYRVCFHCQSGRLSARPPIA
jgi:hypothetical protein